ncbi:MAG: TIGR03118 family protein [Granulicella sp.]
MHNEMLPLRHSSMPRIVSPVAMFKFAMIALLTAAACVPAAAQAFQVTNIISDGSVPATVTDANFINPWGVSTSPTLWISAQGTGFNYVSSPVTGAIAFKVIVSAASGLPGATGLPAGSATTAGATGMILPNGTKASFLFSTLDGTISGWNGKLGTANAISQIVVNNGGTTGATYTGLAILNVGTSSYVLAPNFGVANKIEVYDNTFAPTTLAGGSFTDPTLPASYAPYAVHVIGTQVFVTYALRTAAAPYRTVNAAGNGIVSIFDNTGKFVSRAVTGGNLNSPWGVAIAPANFGIYSSDLLIGNFGDGRINVYDPKTFGYLGQLMDGTGKPLTYASLWELLPGGTTVTGTTSVSGGDVSTVYFTAGLDKEAHGLLAGIANTTTAGSTPTFGFSASVGAATVTAGSSTTATIVVAPVNGFSGTVTLACSGLPVSATCSFSPASITATASAGATSTVTIQTAKASASVQAPRLWKNYAGGIASAFLLPFASILVFRRRRMLSGKPSLRLLGVMVVFLAVGGLLLGCSNYMAPTPAPTPTPTTPAGLSTVVITATSGAISQQTSVALTVQ